ncbi:MAG: glycosyltransferase family 4 protein [Anaeromyxobacteraceae bacterium]
MTLDSTQESVPPPPLSRRLWAALRRASRFLKLLHTGKPDAVLLFASSGFSFMEKASYAVYARIFGVPSLLSIRSGHFLDQCRRSASFRTVAQALLAAPALLLCQGEQWRRFFIDELHIPEERCPILDSWVATEPLLKIGRERRPRAATPVRVLFMGWLESFKGLYDLLEAVAILKTDPDTPAFELLLAGDGSQRVAAEVFVGQRGLEGVVRFMGWVRGDDKLSLLASSQLFVLPSHTEGLPNAMIEAMAAALPVVVTPVGSIPDVIQDGENGRLVPCREPVALARALGDLLRTPAERERIGTAAYDHALARFTIEKASEKLATLIANCTREP